MWKDLITAASKDATLSPPASGPAISTAEKSLAVPFPTDLRSLLLETDGVSDQYGAGTVWPLERIVQDNQDFRTKTDFRDLYMPFDSLLFFGDAGNGDQFGYAILNGVIRKNDVFVWNHEDDSRTWVASSLKDYLERWLKGDLSV